MNSEKQGRTKFHSVRGKLQAFSCEGRGKRKPRNKEKNRESLGKRKGGVTGVLTQMSRDQKTSFVSLMWSIRKGAT